MVWFLLIKCYIVGFWLHFGISSSDLFEVTDFLKSRCEHKVLDFWFLQELQSWRWLFDTVVIFPFLLFFADECFLLEMNSWLFIVRFSQAEIFSSFRVCNDITFLFFEVTDIREFIWVCVVRNASNNLTRILRLEVIWAARPEVLGLKVYSKVTGLRLLVKI